MGVTANIDVPGDKWVLGATGEESGYFSSRTGKPLMFKVAAALPDWNEQDGHILKPWGKENYSLAAGQLLYFRQTESLVEGFSSIVVITPD